MRNPFKKSHKQLLNEAEKIKQKLQEHIQKDRELIIDHIILLDEHYVVETLQELQGMSLQELTAKLETYMRALREDVGLDTEL